MRTNVCLQILFFIAVIVSPAEASNFLNLKFGSWLNSFLSRFTNRGGNSSADCPEISSTYVCTQVYIPVICDDLCEYGNQCEAVSAGYTPNPGAGGMPDNCRLK
jgi:hypothetical protein